MFLRPSVTSSGQGAPAHMALSLRTCACACILAFLPGPLRAQGQEVRLALPDTSPFQPLPLRSPNAYRTAAGTPGPLYWQQRVDYSIQAELDTATHRIRGMEIITYTNHSPDTLRYLWIQLDQNLGSADNPLRMLSQRYEDEEGFIGGYTVDVVAEASAVEPEKQALARPLAHRVDGTLMQVMLNEPLAPGEATRVEIGWEFQVPLFWRTSRQRVDQGWLYEVGQWFPRLCVYDDARGWNTEPYTGHGEFYLEYGDIDYAITAPAPYTVTGTGILQNPEEVLTAQQRRRLSLAERSDTIIHVISPEEIGAASSVPTGVGETRTWRFRAEGVRDVAWAAAPDFIWDATGWDGILIQALYPPSGLPVWSRAAEETRFVIQDYSNRLGRYPYPTAINVHGPVHGMEYPMVVFCSGQESDRHLFVCACHELGHQWFPMTVGSNERLFGWQDEGLVNFIGISVFHDRLPDDDGMEAGFAPDGMVEWLPPLVNPEHTIMMPIDWGPNSIYFLHTVKSAVALNLLRREIVDSVALDAALREYATRWAFKHPTPADFFRTIDDALGKDLSWFWGSWFFRTDQLDFAIDSVTQSESEGTVTSEIHFSRKARMVAPVDFFIQGADGTEQHVRVPVEVWQLGPSHAYPLITSTAAQPIRIEIDHKRAFPDIDRENNTWVRRE